MSRRARTNAVTISERRGGFSIRREALGVFSLLVGAFFFLCLLSYDPLDPSFFTAARGRVMNLGGMFGAYLAGTFVFLIGGGGYFLGLYFLINAWLLLSGRRNDLRWADFAVYLACSTFIAVLLDLYFGIFIFGDTAVNAGGTLGRILGDTGARYLGRWGISLVVLFGSVLTFILATRLPLVTTIGTSSIVIGKGLGSLSGQLYVAAARARKLAGRALRSLLAWGLRLRARLGKPSPIVALPASAKLHAFPPPSASLPAPPSLVPPPSPDIDRLMPLRPSEPVLRSRRDARPVAPRPRQLEFREVGEGWRFPSLDFLDHEESKTAPVDAAALKMSARLLEKKLKDFLIDGQVTEIHPGPIITMHEFQPAPGVKLSRIQGLTDDLSLAMGGRPVRIVAPLPNKAAVGIEIPNFERETVWLKEIVANERFQNHKSRLAFALGKDIEGAPFVADLERMPHLLVAGATGAGKSVAVNSMICSFLYKSRPDDVRLIMIDPKMIELSIYDGIPHLLLPVVTDSKKAHLALKWAVREMERRYHLMSDVNARNLANYNRRIEAGEIKSGPLAGPSPEDGDPVVHEGKLPYIVVIVDEFADLMMVSSKEVEELVCRLAQKARAAGIHVILATQRPSVDVITGLIKANFPSRISFKVTSKHDSRTILDTVGAEHLLGMGDMLFIPPGISQAVRLHGAFVTEKEIARVVSYLKEQARPVYDESILSPGESGGTFDGGDGESGEGLDEFYDEAVQEAVENRRVSISSVQRRFRIGYNRAARLVERMEEQGVVSPPNSQGQRQVLVGG